QWTKPGKRALHRPRHRLREITVPRRNLFGSGEAAFGDDTGGHSVKVVEVAWGDLSAKSHVSSAIASRPLRGACLGRPQTVAILGGLRRAFQPAPAGRAVPGSFRRPAQRSPHDRLP